MRYLGLIGGMSWESTAEYYRLINRGVAERLGGLHSAPLLVHSVDFAPLADMQRGGDWGAAGALVADAARGLERAGAEALLITSNTMHHVVPAIEEAVRLPLLHIVDPAGEALRHAGVRRAALLGTRFTMELPFWRGRLTERFGVELVVPGERDRETVHRVIYEELCRGVIDDASRDAFVDIIARLRDDGAEGVILGCTEIGLLVRPDDSPLPVYDTSALHAAAAVDFLVGAAEWGVAAGPPLTRAG